MKLDSKHMRTIKMFNASYSRACFHRKKRVRKKNYKRARYMMRRGNQISRKEWKKYTSYKIK